MPPPGDTRTLERAWWLRTLLVLQSPRTVFAALRDDSDEAVDARQEPVLAMVILAGIAGVLATNIAGTLLDDPEFDAVNIAAWAFIGGTIYGALLYYVVGGLAYLGAYWAGGEGTYRRARHIVAYAAVPFALSLVVWLVRLAIYGDDMFRSGGSDTGAGSSAFEAFEVGLLAWSAALLALGIRTVHGWTWPRALAATAVPGIVPALALARAYGLF